eukprot:3446702-Rhodomonas_salina.5
MVPCPTQLSHTQRDTARFCEGHPSQRRFGVRSERRNMQFRCCESQGRRCKRMAEGPMSSRGAPADLGVGMPDDGVESGVESADGRHFDGRRKLVSRPRPHGFPCSAPQVCHPARAVATGRSRRPRLHHPSSRPFKHHRHRHHHAKNTHTRNNDSKRHLFHRLCRPLCSALSSAPAALSRAAIPPKQSPPMLKPPLDHPATQRLNHHNNHRKQRQHHQELRTSQMTRPESDLPEVSGSAVGEIQKPLAQRALSLLQQASTPLRALLLLLGNGNGGGGPGVEVHGLQDPLPQVVARPTHLPPAPALSEVGTTGCCWTLKVSLLACGTGFGLRSASARVLAYPAEG